MILSLLIFCLFPIKAKCQDVNLDPTSMQPKIDELVGQYVDLDIFSGVVLVADKGKPVYHKAFGLSNREKNIANTTDTKFIIGSMNKTFTQAVIMNLIDEGKLSYDDKLVTLLKGFTQRGVEEITVAQLVNHTSGFGDYFSPEFENMPYKNKNIKGITELIKNLDLHFEPGTEDLYSNAGYILLGAIIEKVTGLSYADNVRKYVVDPLNMSHTYLENNSTVPQKSIGYSKTIDGVIDNIPFVTEPRSDGGFWSTALDVMTFYRSFFNDTTIITKASKLNSEFFNQIEPYYSESGACIPMAGGMNGLNTVHFQMLKEDISIVVLANMDEPVAEKIGQGILNIIKGKAPEKAELPAVYNVQLAIQDKGVEYVVKNFDALTVNFHPTDPKDLILNAVGYNFLFSGDVKQAIAVFKANTELFPNVANCWDSLGEAYAKEKDTKNAIQAYEMALQKDPNLRSSQLALKGLKSK